MLFKQFFVFLGERKSAVHNLWKMCSSVDRNWDGVILGNVNKCDFT